MTERQKTGIWFVITGVLLLSLWTVAYAIVNWSIESGFAAINMDNFSDEHKYILGASGVVALQLASLTGIPFVITGVAQIITGTQTANKSKKK